MVYPNDDQHIGFHYKFTVGGKDRLNASIFRTDGLIVIVFVKRGSTITGLKQQQLKNDTEVIANVQEVLNDVSKSTYEGETLTADDVLTIFHELQSTNISDLQTDYSAQEQVSESISTSVAEPKKTNTTIPKESAYTILKAKRLDAEDACNIIDPVDVISPCGCHYSNNDLQFLLDKNYCSSVPEAYAILANNEKYKSLPADVQQKIDNGTIKLDNDSLLGYFQLSEDDITVAAQTDNNSQTYRNPSKQNSDSAAQQNTVGDPREAVGMKVGTQNDNTSTDTITSAIQDNRPIAENDFVQWLLENTNRIFRDDARRPQIPTSIGVSIAMVRGTNSPAVFGRYNWWKLPYDGSLTNIPQDSEDCAFSAPRDGILAIISLLHTDNYKLILQQLKPQMWDDTEEVKQSVTRAILLKLSGDKAEEHYNKVMEYVQRFNMREWDTEKVEAEGGHADTKANSSDDSKRTENRMASAVKHFTETLRDKGLGVLVIPLGPNYSRIIKLPVGKTHCEPVYPDYVTVGDKIPEWIMSESYAKLAKEAEEAALKAAGIVIKTQNEIELEYINSKLDAFNEERFTAWCQENNVSYTNEEEHENARKLYTEAAAKDPEHFTDGIYTPDSASKSAYQELLKEKNTLTSNGDIAVSTARAQYLSAAETAAKEISDRESGWNQDSGHTLSSSDMGNTGGNFSAVNSNDSDNVNVNVSGSIKQMVTWASKIAADQTHGYSQANRTGPDYDCSSFVFYALDAGGFNAIATNGGYAGTTDDVWPVLQKIGGWKRYNWSDISNSIMYGDILHRESGHVAIAISNDKTVEASGVGSGQGSPATGDQGREIDNYNIQGRAWDYVYRYQGS